MRATKASIVPHRCSASAAHASLADTTAAALTSSSTVMISPGSSQIWDPPIPAAVAEQVTFSSHDSCPSAMASITSSSVITFVTEAIGRCSRAFCSNSTAPLP